MEKIILIKNYTKKEILLKEEIIGLIPFALFTIDLIPHLLARWNEIS
ncbi:hypothetical protein [Myroides injenensis]|nr:hypothetical protein [Myroides injenensis]